MLVIPAIDLIGGRCVRLRQGCYDRVTTYPLTPVQQALAFQRAGFRRLHLVDLEGARNGRGRNREIILEICRAVRLPVQTGGGIRTGQDVRELLEAGVSRLILGTAALEQPAGVAEWIARWGAERFVISLDLAGGRLRSRGWLEESEQTLPEALARIAGWGVRELICTDVERDGTLSQPNYDTYRSLLPLLPSATTLLAAGGVSRRVHLQELEELGVGGAVVGRALYERGARWEEFLHAG